MSLARVHLRRVTKHRGRTALAAMGIAVATTLVTAIAAVDDSVSNSLDRLVELAGNADVELAGPADTGFDQRIYRDLAAFDGVETAVPAIRSDIVIGTTKVLLFGIDARAAALDGGLGDEIDQRAGASDNLNGVFLTETLADRLGVQRGSALTVLGLGHERATEVIDTVDGGLADINGGLVAIAPLPVAQDLAGKAGRLDVVWVVGDGSRSPEALRADLAGAFGDRLLVGSPKLRAAQLAGVLERPLRQLRLISWAVLVVGGFLVFTTTTMAGADRRREVATLKALGGRAGPVVRGFALEAAVVGVLGAAAGAGVGAWLARLLVGRLPPALVSRLGVEPAFTLESDTVPFAVSLGVITAVLSSLIPAWRATRVPPAEALRPEGAHGAIVTSVSVRRATTVLGLLGAGAGLVMIMGVFGDAVLVGAGLFLVGCVLVMAGLAPLITRLAALFARTGRSAGRVAAATLEREPQRVWVTTAGVALALAVTVTVAGLTANVRSAVAEWFAPVRDLDLVVQTYESDELPGSTVMPPEWRGRLGEIQGVEAVRRQRAIVSTLGDQRILVLGVEETTKDAIASRADPDGRRRLFSEDAAVVTTPFALAHDVEVGSIVDLPTPAGRRALEIVDVVDSTPNLPGGILVADVAAVERWYGANGATAYEVDVADGSDVGDVRAAVTRMAQSASFPVVVLSGQELFEGALAISDQFRSVFAAVSLIMLGAASVSILNALVLSVSTRSRELGVLRAIGASRRSLRRSVLLEAGAVAFVAAVIALAIGSLFHFAAVRGAGEFLGLVPPYRFETSTLALVVGIACTMAFIGAWFPARRTAAMPIVAAIGYE